MIGFKLEKNDGESSLYLTFNDNSRDDWYLLDFRIDGEVKTIDGINNDTMAGEDNMIAVGDS